MDKKTLFGIALGISIAGWILDLAEFDGNILLSLFEVSIMSIIIFLILNMVLISYTMVKRLFRRES